MGIDPLSAGVLAAGVMSGAGSIIGGNAQASATKDANAMNIAFQKDANAQNERLMREAWGRDDSAVMRRAADLRAAGLSKSLAAGSAAAASSPIKLEAPKVEAEQGMGAAISGIGSMISTIPQKMMSLKIGDAQAALMRNQNLTEVTKQGKNKADEAKAYADAGFKKAAKEIAEQDIESWVRDRVARADAGNVAKTFRLANDLGFGIGDGIKGGAEGIKREKFNSLPRQKQEEIVKGGFAPEEWLK